MLTCNKLTLIKNNKTIFRDLGFALGTGSVLVITGGNGSGKTSLLKIIAGIIKPQAGEILWGDFTVEKIREDFYGDMQFIGHKNFLKSQLSVKENIEFYAKLSDTQMAVSSALSFFDLNDISHEQVKNLSAGVQQRIRLSLLLACPATLWLLDEPSTNLDQFYKEKLHGLIKTRIKEQGMVLLATHDEFFFDLGLKINVEDFKN
ncbi:cytochrome c biogenesis ATP-binding export protein CcmA [Alphaproteobacteria bacterium]|nr:cytochrome c biogenesis ATP-binding export protein CcmA [Alphaproteobacteria bacterium]